MSAYGEGVGDSLGIGNTQGMSSCKTAAAWLSGDLGPGWREWGVGWSESIRLQPEI